MFKRAGRRMYLLMGVVLYCALWHGAAFAEAESDVRVGLFYGQNTEHVLKIENPSGLTLMQGQSVCVAIAPGVDIMIYKDGFYDVNGQREASGEMYAGLEGAKGSYHIQIGSGYARYEDAQKRLSELGTVNEALYPAYTGEWRLYYGNFVSIAAAEAARDTLPAGIKALGPSVVASGPDQVIVYASDMPLFSYPANDESLCWRTAFFGFSGKQYRDGFSVRRLPGSDLTLVNTVTLQHYLYGVVPKEMSGGWPLEALKAQAVAARNFVLTYGDAYARYGFDVCPSTRCQVYGGYSAEAPMSNRAVDDTEGQVLLHNGQVVPLYYHANSGGITDDSENVWNTALSYIRRADDVYSLDKPGSRWTYRIEASDLEAALMEKGLSVGRVHTLEISERADSGRVLAVVVRGTSGAASLEKGMLRALLGGTKLKSMLFGFSETVATVTPATGPIAQGPVVSRGQIDLLTPVAPRDQRTRPVYVVSRGGVYAVCKPDGAMEMYAGDSRVAVSGEGALPSESSGRQTAYVRYPYPPTEEGVFSGGGLTLFGHGYGHGLGMSQWGAKTMAEQGQLYSDILAHYYDGTVLGTLPTHP